MLHGLIVFMGCKKGFQIQPSLLYKFIQRDIAVCIESATMFLSLKVLQWRNNKNYSRHADKDYSIYLLQILISGGATLTISRLLSDGCATSGLCEREETSTAVLLDFLEGTCIGRTVPLGDRPYVSLVNERAVLSRQVLYFQEGSFELPH